MPSILADFTRLHRGAALPLDLTDDRQYWQYIQRWYSGLAALRGIDAWEQMPFDQDGNPAPMIETPPMLVWVNANIWRALCPGCQRSGPVRRASELTICLGCWGFDRDNVRWTRVEWPAETLAAERRLLARPNPEHRNWHRQQPYQETLADLVAEDQERGLA